LKVSGLYYKKIKFPLKISDRAWWLEVLVLKTPGKACQTKAVVTEVESERKKPVETLEGKREISCIPHVSAAENVGHFKNMRRGC